LAGLGVVIVFGYAFSWLYAAVEIATKDPETAQVAWHRVLLRAHVHQERDRPHRDHARLAPAA
jgi:hypothetical protein